VDSSDDNAIVDRRKTSKKTSTKKKNNNKNNNTKKKKKKTTKNSNENNENNKMVDGVSRVDGDESSGKDHDNDGDGDIDEVNVNLLNVNHDDQVLADDGSGSGNDSDGDDNRVVGDGDGDDAEEEEEDEEDDDFPAEDSDGEEEEEEEEEESDESDEEESVGEEEEEEQKEASEEGEEEIFSLSILRRGDNIQISSSMMDIRDRDVLSLNFTQDQFDRWFDGDAEEDWLRDHPSMKRGREEEEDEPIELETCLQLYTEKEQLGPDDLWYCNKCKDHKQATKKFDLWKLPPFIVIHLKRFSYKNRYSRDKLETRVNFPLTGLDLSAHQLSSDANSPPPVYDLMGVSNHYGALGGGHYTAFAKNFNTGHWYKFDDSHVSTVSEEQVCSSAAYVLFYCRQDTHQWLNDIEKPLRSVKKEESEEEDRPSPYNRTYYSHPPRPIYSHDSEDDTDEDDRKNDDSEDDSGENEDDDDEDDEDDDDESRYGKPGRGSLNSQQDDMDEESYDGHQVSEDDDGVDDGGLDLPDEMVSELPKSDHDSMSDNDDGNLNEDDSSEMRSATNLLTQDLDEASPGVATHESQTEPDTDEQ